MSFKDELTGLVSDINKTLGDSTLLPQPVSWESSSLKPLEWSFGQSFSIGVNAKVEVSLFNSETDKDIYGVFGKKVSDQGNPGIFDSVKADSLLIPDQTNAWLRYAFMLDAKGDASTNIGTGIGIEGSAEGKALIAWYRKHLLTDSLSDVALETVGGLLNGGSIEDSVFLPSDGHASLYRIYGSLGASLSLSYADSFSFVATGAREIFGESIEIVSGVFKAGAEMKLTAKIQDEFQVAVAGNVDDVTVSVNKSKLKEFGVGLSVSISIADLKYNESALSDFLDSTFEEIFPKVQLPSGVSTAKDAIDELNGHIDAFRDVGSLGAVFKLPPHPDNN
ncbi:MAG: hypothetical protein ACPGN3_10780 [Opitutales bacterium]